MTEDTAAALAKGGTPQSFAATPIDLAHSLAPFMIITDESGKSLVSLARFNDGQLVSPKGTLDFVKENTEHSFTWQPAGGVRPATVVVHYDGKQPGFVIVGRSMHEIKKRETALTEVS